MTVRKSLSKKTRFEVFKRDGFKCSYCGAHPPNVLLHVDHIVPVAEGGGNEEDNLTTACEACNLGKSATPLSVVPKSLADKAGEAAEREEQLRGYSNVMRSVRERIEDEAWEVAELYMAAFDLDGMHKPDLLSIKKFVEKLGLHETLDSMEIATAKKPYSRAGCFSYFCGVCWSKIKEAGLARA